MLPSPASLDPEVDYHTWRSSRNASMHSIDGPNPPINVDDRDVPAEGVLRSFLANSACWRPLVNREEGEGAPQSNSSDLWITTKSIVTLIDDFPTYNLSALNQSMVERASWKVSLAVPCSRFLPPTLTKLGWCAHTKRANCHYGLFGDFPCGRDFTKDGHFENLIEFDDARDGDKTTATKMGWRYSPFLTTTFGYPGPLDHVKVPLEGSTEEDGAFLRPCSRSLARREAHAPASQTSPSIGTSRGHPSPRSSFMPRACSASRCRATRTRRTGRSLIARKLKTPLTSSVRCP